MLAIPNDNDNGVFVYTKAALDNEAKEAFKAEMYHCQLKPSDFRQLPWTIRVNKDASVTLIVPILCKVTGFTRNHNVAL